MDLSLLDTRAAADTGFDVALRHPKTDEPIGAVIRVLGADSDAYQHQVLEQQRERMQKMARQGRTAMASPEQMNEQAIALLAAATIGWQDIIVSGASVPFSNGAAQKLYRDFPWIREQVDEAIHTRANFLPRSATS